MAAPHCQLSAVPGRLQWRCAPLDAEVVCASAVLETIRRQAVEDLSRLSHGGLETGGVLLGQRSERSIEIVGALPIECEHKLGPSFLLSAADEASLKAALASDKLGALQPVGLYISHSRRGFSVADSDLEIIDTHFPEPWQMALILVPAKLGPTRAGFFVRKTVGEPAFVCAHEFSLSAQERPREAAVSVPQSVVAQALSRIRPKPGDVATANSAATTTSIPTAVVQVTDDPNPVSGQATALQRLHSFLAQEQQHWRLSRWNLAATLTLLLLCVSAGGFWLRARTVRSPAVLMHVSDLGSKLRIEWDPAQKRVRTASRATLEIRDGGRGPIVIPITRSGLDNGSVLYVPQSENVEVRLKLMQGKGTLSESVIYFINPSRMAAAPAAIVPPSPPVILAAPPVVTLPAKTSPPMPRQAPDHKKIISKAFRLPVSRAVNASASRPMINLPDLPDIRTTQASVPTLPLANDSSAMAHLLAPQTRPVGPPQLRSGHLIWTGTLRKNAMLSITPEGASSGVLNGRLPGTPVKISLQPAELVDSGIAVYSKDGERSGTSEPPTAWNGWNVVFYDWDAKRIAEVDVVEAPSSSNNWKRLVLRNGKRNVSVLVVNWQRLAQPPY